jgi:hypothetical protein
MLEIVVELSDRDGGIRQEPLQVSVLVTFNFHEKLLRKNNFSDNPKLHENKAVNKGS